MLGKQTYWLFLSLPVKKENKNKFSSQNIVTSSQNNVWDNMNKFIDSRKFLNHFEATENQAKSDLFG